MQITEAYMPEKNHRLYNYCFWILLMDASSVKIIGCYVKFRLKSSRKKWNSE